MATTTSEVAAARGQQGAADGMNIFTAIRAALVAAGHTGRTNIQIKADQSGFTGTVNGKPVSGRFGLDNLVLVD